MAWRFVVAPQWQGSGSSRAMRLIDGAEAIAGDLPSSRTTRVDVPSGAGDALGTAVHRLSSVVAVRDRLGQVLGSFETDDTPLLIGGDCGIELAAVTQALTSHPDTCVVWFDAHGDLNTSESSPSAAFSGMVLRTLLGDGPDYATPTTPLATDRVVLVGARALDSGEAEFIEATGLRRIAASGQTAADVVAAVEATGASSVYIHVDLDVLDPSVIAGVSSAEPFGLLLDDLVAAIRGLRESKSLIGASILGFAPESPAAAVDDLPTILRIISAITSR